MRIRKHVMTIFIPIIFDIVVGLFGLSFLYCFIEHDPGYKYIATMSSKSLTSEMQSICN